VALTGADAKDALLELIRSKPKGMGWADPVKLSKEAVVYDTATDTGSFGPLDLDFARRTYAFTILYGGTRGCALRYQGSFQLRQGRWVALPPRR
jgi:hypothetical protein